MERELKFDRAIYAVDDAALLYQFLRRNPAWREMCAAENEANKTQLDGYVRVLGSGETIPYDHAKPSPAKAH